MYFLRHAVWNATSHYLATMLGCFCDAVVFALQRRSAYWGCALRAFVNWDLYIKCCAQRPLLSVVSVVTVALHCWMRRVTRFDEMGRVATLTSKRLLLWYDELLMLYIETIGVHCEITFKFTELPVRWYIETIGVHCEITFNFTEGKVAHWNNWGSLWASSVKPDWAVSP